MLSLADAVAKFICKEDLLRPGDRIGLAVSGGADSVALLRLMLDLRLHLGVVLWVLHFNHKLREEDSDSDEQFVRELSQRNGLDFLCGSADAAAHAKEKHLSLEAGARSLRYDFFLRAMQEACLDSVATAHTLDDQAETVLLKLARGAGTRGMSGIYPKLTVASLLSSDKSGRSIIRPLLGLSRRDIELYLRELDQPWREDKSNRDLRHSRNLVRHGILPRLQGSLNPSIREALAETAEIARAEEEYWNAKVAEFMASASDDSALNRELLRAQPLAVQRRLVRAHAEHLGFKLDFKHVQQILDIAASQLSGGKVGLPGGWKAELGDRRILFQRGDQVRIFDYEYELPIPGRIEVPEAGSIIEALLARTCGQSAYNPLDAIDVSLVTRNLRVRNWRAGDKFWPANSKAPRKIKELLQQVHSTGAERKCVPVVVSGDEVIWLRGFRSPSALRPSDPRKDAIIIQETIIS